MSKHTPGPWGVRGNEETWAVFGEVALAEMGEVWSESGVFVTEVATGDADARLIAAAPELLESLKEAIDFYREVYTGENSPPCEPDRWIEAVAKAEGDA